MIDKLLFMGRFGMLALLFLFLLRLAVILGRATMPEKVKVTKKVESAPEPKKPKQPEPQGSLRLLQGETKVWLKEVKGEDELKPGAIVAVQGLLSLGRAPGNDIRLEDPFASAFHARIRVARQGLVIEDLGTTNGTRVNGVRINSPVQIQPGDIVDVGSTSFAVEE